MMPTPLSAQSDAIQPFKVHFPDTALADLRRRIAATRWPTPRTGRGCDARRATRHHAQARAVLAERA